MDRILIVSAFILAAASSANAGPNGREIVVGGWGCRGCDYSNGTNRDGAASNTGSLQVLALVGSEEATIDYPKQSIDVETNKLKRPYGR